MSRACPNCCVNSVEDHPENGCVLAALIGVIRDRADISDEQRQEIHATCDVDALWNDIGKIVDRLEEGEYS